MRYKATFLVGFVVTAAVYLVLNPDLLRKRLAT